MKAQHRIVVAGTPAELGPRVAAFFLGEGYETVPGGGDRLAFTRPGRALAARVDRLPRRVDVDLRAQGQGDDPPRTAIWLRYACRTTLRLPSRIDALFFRLESESLARFLERGVRMDAGERAESVRRPVQSVLAVNVVTAAVIVAAAGSMAGFPVWVIIATTVAVALLDVLAIVGFADVLVTALDDLREG